MRVVLAGAGGAIGQQVVSRLVENGHQVIGLDSDERVLGELPDTVDTRALDLSDEQAVRRQLTDTDVDAVISCVGWYELRSLEDCSPDSLRDHLESNLVAVHTLVHALLPTLRARSGKIVVVGSMVGSVPLPYHGAYSASKAGLAGYVESLRQELRPRGVDVSLIEPGPVRTGFNERAVASLDQFEGSAYDKQYRAFESYSPESTTVQKVAETIRRSLESERPRGTYRVGRRARWLPRLRLLLPTRLYDRLVRSGLPGGILHRLIDR